MSVMRVAVLITCHNRARTTLRCLSQLYECKVPEHMAYDVWVKDDGCTDDTVASIVCYFPKVMIVKGSGADYWCGGMRRAWTAAEHNYRYDGYLWLNDDTMLYEDALYLMLSNEHMRDSIMVGATKDPCRDRTSYSARNRRGQKMDPSGHYQHAFAFNGNCVWIPREVFDKLGNFPEYFTHALGDFDYGLRANKAGISIFLVPNYVGECDDVKPKAAWMDSNVNIVKRLMSLYSPKGGPEPRIFFKYNMNHFGILKAVRCFVLQHLRVLFPLLWRFKQ